MTKWLQAAKQAIGTDAGPEEPTQPHAKPVLSVLSVLSEGGTPDPARHVATSLRLKPEPMPPARADGLDPDAGAYLDRLRLHGPATYGAMASTLGWGATRAWRAEAKLGAAGNETLCCCSLKTVWNVWCLPAHDRRHHARAIYRHKKVRTSAGQGIQRVRRRSP